MHSLRFVAAVVCTCIAVTGCRSDKTEKVYPFGVAEAVQRLDDADNGGFRYHRHCGVLFDIGSFRTDDNAVTWTARADRRDIFSFTVTVVEVPKGVTTKVSVQLDEDGREMYDGTRKYNHPLIPQPLRPAIAELIASALEQRPFDNERIDEKFRYLNYDKDPSAGACSEDMQTLERGFPLSYDDPPGIPIETVQKMAAKFNWPKN